MKVEKDKQISLIVLWREQAENLVKFMEKKVHKLECREEFKQAVMKVIREQFTQQM